MKWLYEKKMERLNKPAVLDKFFDKENILNNDSLAGLAEFEADGMSAEQMAAYQKHAVQDIVRYAYDKSPFYRDKLLQAGVLPDEIKEIEDLSRLPFTTKDELRGNPWILLACDKKDIAIIQVSTGTWGGRNLYNEYLA